MNTTREPLAIRGAVVAAVEAILHFLVMVGLVPLTPEAEAQAAVVVALVGTAVLVVWTRGKVTPVDAPRDNDGTPLVPGLTYGSGTHGSSGG